MEEIARLLYIGNDALSQVQKASEKAQNMSDSSLRRVEQEPLSRLGLATTTTTAKKKFKLTSRKTHTQEQTKTND